MKLKITLSLYCFLLLLSLPVFLRGATIAPVDTLTQGENLPEPIPQVRRSFDFSTIEETPSLLPPEEDDLVPGLVEAEQTLESLETIIKARQKVRAALDAGRFIQRLDSLSWIEFPVVLADTISNVPIAIVFDDLRLHPEYAELSVVLHMQLPQKKVSAIAGQEGADNKYVELFFGTPSLKFSHDGGIIGDATIGLYANTPIGMGNPNKFGFILNGLRSLGTASDGSPQYTGTFVTINCDGFVDMGIEAEVFFSRDWIVPVDANDNPTVGRVQGHISTVVSDWQNILVVLDLPHFAPTSYPEVAINLSQAVFDFSDFRNSPNMVFPDAYAEQGLLPPSPSLWRGVYIQHLELSLPRQVKNKNCQGASPPPTGSGTGMLILDENGAYAYGEAMEVKASDQQKDIFDLNLPEYLPPLAGDSAPLELPPLEATTQSCRIKMGAEHLLIDGHGVSGYFYGENVLPLDLGVMDKWRFSIDVLTFEMVASEVVGFGFGGELGVPICKKEQAFTYGAMYNIPDRTLNMFFESQQDYNFPVFKMADAQISAGSYLDITITPSRFEPAAVLYGYAAIKGRVSSESADGDDSQEPPAKLSFTAPRLDFQGLRLATRGALISLEEGSGSLELSAGVKLMGYEIPIPQPILTVLPGGIVKLQLGVSLNLMNQEDHGFAANADVDIKGILNTEEGVQNWASDGVSVGRLEVNIQLEGLEVRGYVHIFEDDPIYGKGFQGSLTVKVGTYTPPEDPLVSIELNAIFGKTTFRYWYVDGFLELDELGIALLPTPLEINGFGGGAYYKMRMGSVDLAGGTDGSLGTMTSGVSYVPDEETTLGLKASLALRTEGSDSFDGVVTLELRFAETGLQEIAFYGKGEFIPKNGIGAGGDIAKFSNNLRGKLTDLPLSQAATQAKDSLEVQDPYDRILATVLLRMNFEEGFEFQGTFRAYISAAGGTLTGQGGVDILISAPQDRWHYYIGGYSDNSIEANDGEVLPPIGIRIDMGEGIEAGADVYFLAGNDLPGPPPLHPAAAAFFNLTNVPGDNRAELGDRAAQGTGFAFGAAVYANFDRRVGRNKNVRLMATIGAGFDVSLLRYESNTYCSISGDSPHGHKGWRATGNIWAYVEGRAEHDTWGGINVALGILISADLPKPTYLLVAGRVEFGWLLNFDFEESIGDRCGFPVVGSN